VRDGGRLDEADGVEPISHAELLGLDCDVLVPAALGGTIHSGNADDLRCRLVVEGANAPTTPKADEILADRGITVVPDVLANAGGVVVSYFEWVQNLQHVTWDADEVDAKLEEIMTRAYREIADRAEDEDVTLRVAAYEQGIERVVEAARLRGYIHS
jgi:glutamate dehydrogenase (NAD(P)+)